MCYPTLLSRVPQTGKSAVCHPLSLGRKRQHSQLFFWSETILKLRFGPKRAQQNSHCPLLRRFWHGQVWYLKAEVRAKMQKCPSQHPLPGHSWWVTAGWRGVWEAEELCCSRPGWDWVSQHSHHMHLCHAHRSPLGFPGKAGASTPVSIPWKTKELSRNIHPRSQQSNPQSPTPVSTEE